jgi:thiamine biosynthesis lipoprotein
MNFQTWGLSGSLSTEHHEDMAFAEERLWHWIDAFDAACNRFRSDSEISLLNSIHDQPVPVSDTLARSIDAALLASSITGGLCDPTILPALMALGYDRDYDQLAKAPPRKLGTAAPAPGITAITFDRNNQTVKLAPGCQLDLGASAKALVADLVADDIATLGGVVVEVGGDVAVRGRGPSGQWVIGVADSLTITGSEPRIAFGGGGIATSSTTARTWSAGDDVINHIVDPRTGTYARGPIATATVSASSCVIANAFSTAALLWGDDAGFHIAQAGWSGRLVRHDGSVEFVGGWPHEEENFE